MTLIHSSGEQNLQSLGKLFRSSTRQKDKTDSHWRKRDAKEPLRRQKPPVSGEIIPLKHTSKG